MSDKYPIWIAPGIRQGDSFVFHGPSSELIIDTFVDELEAVLYLCNGRNTIPEIEKQITPELRPLVQDLVEDLISLEILVDSRELYKAFHRRTLNPPDFSRSMTSNEIKAHLESPRTPLPSGFRIELALESKDRILLERRGTCRNFDDRALDHQTLSSILVHTTSHIGGPAPSAGGLFPLQIYMVVFRGSNEVPKGLYGFDGVDQSLVRLELDFNREALSYAFNSDVIVGNAPVVLIVAADLDRHPAKYANRGYRFTLLEAGHVSQNIQLIASALGLGAFEYGGFMDRALQIELQMPVSVKPLIAIGVGYSAAKSAETTEETLERLTQRYVGSGRPVNRLFTSLYEGKDGENFYAATSHYRPAPGENARRSYQNRFASGVGQSVSEARLKALAEGVERYKSGRISIDIECAAIDLNIPFLDVRQVAPLTPDQLNRQGLMRFNINAACQWRIGRNMADNSGIAVPVDLIYYPLAESSIGRQLFHAANSSGVAAHLSRGEAEKRGLLELIERDSLMKTWLTQLPPRRVALESMSTSIRQRAQFWANHGYAMCILDLSEYGVSIAQVVIHRSEFPAQSNGAAASLESFEHAAKKALSEAEYSLTLEIKHQQKLVSLSTSQVRSPADHAQFYLDPDHFSEIEWLVQSDHKEVGTEPTTTYNDLLQQLCPVAVDLTQDLEEIQVIRVLCDQLVPINFGYQTEHYTHHALAASIQCAPFWLPHFFA